MEASHQERERGRPGIDGMTATMVKGATAGSLFADAIKSALTRRWWLLSFAIESGASRGLRTLGLFVDFQKKTQIAELQLGRALTETEEKQISYNAVMRD